MLMTELPPLTNVIDEIVCEELHAFSIDDQIELMETCLQLIQDYMDDNTNAISDPDFCETLSDEIFEILDEQLQEMIVHGITSGPTDDVLLDTVEFAIEYYFAYMCIPRSQNEVISVPTSDPISTPINTPTSTPISTPISTPTSDEITTQEKMDKHIKTRDQIAYLESLPQPAQRTPEWYVYRHNLITASNAYKAFETQSSKNALIYEKCKPINMSSSGHVNVSSPMHWGQKYEAISVMIYENKYNATIKDFGCIQHRTYSFIGASPDGINTDESSPYYGRMLEIKNPTTRVITGEPKKEYWVQCQLQMETCDLDECDFLETKFAEYETEQAFEEDGSYGLSSKQEIKGIMLYFADQDGVPKYIYKPLNMDKQEFVTWEQETIEMYEDKHNYTWIKNNYWKLVQLSCVLVKRNVMWFQANVKAMEDLWKIVLEERETGYEHRAPKPRTQKVPVPDNKITNYMGTIAEGLNATPKSGCLLKLSKNPFTGVVTVIKTDNHHVIM
jgi:putative phage-type endonuclease